MLCISSMSIGMKETNKTKPLSTLGDFISFAIDKTLKQQPASNKKNKTLMQQIKEVESDTALSQLERNTQLRDLYNQLCDKNKNLKQKYALAEYKNKYDAYVLAVKELELEAKKSVTIIAFPPLQQAKEAPAISNPIISENDTRKTQLEDQIDDIKLNNYLTKTERCANLIPLYEQLAELAGQNYDEREQYLAQVKKNEITKLRHEIKEQIKILQERDDKQGLKIAYNSLANTYTQQEKRDYYHSLITNLSKDILFNNTISLLNEKIENTRLINHPNEFTRLDTLAGLFQKRAAQYATRRSEYKNNHEQDSQMARSYRLQSLACEGITKNTKQAIIRSLQS